MMDVFDVFLQAGLITFALTAYLILRAKPVPTNTKHRQPGWNFPLKYLFALYAVHRWKSRSRRQLAPCSDLPKSELFDGWDGIQFRASSGDGATVLLGIRKQNSTQVIAEVTVLVKLPDGTCYQLPRHPDTAVGVWESYEDGWSAGGLKIQVLEPQFRLRIIYNGLLTRTHDGVNQHVNMNFIWASASEPVRHPEDWSIQLASRALAMEPWRDGDWINLLDKVREGSSIQWGAIQGRFQAFNSQGIVETTEYLRVRGVKERSWNRELQSPRRSVTIVAAARDGTAIYLKASSHKHVLTKCIHGCVRFPNSEVVSLKSTDFTLSDFAENPKGIPKVYTINVAAKDRNLKLVIRINETGDKVYEGVPYKQKTVYRSIHTDIDEYHGTGILELGYEVTGVMQPRTRLSPRPKLRWLPESEAGEFGYCLSFEDKACTCTELVGGKGASLALLSSLQRQEGYRVPPGYCLTTKALEKQLESNPGLKAAILEIEAANENYVESNLKRKCERASELITKTAVTKEIKEEILKHLNKLREEALNQNLGPKLQFAVRSSAVGEDSEAMSAAGQNETILGCSSDDDVLVGVQKCWASMFAFTSAYYRRQNGQPCLCGGAVVVQALVAPVSAGVMFTRHPQAGDPSRLLITANYGLGESVVSGAVEPDTFEVYRHEETLKICKTDLGSKNQRVKASSNGVTTENVPEAERNSSCLSEEMIMKLAKIGVSQEELWGAGRDIEWAVTETDIFLLQARPITSLERWSEEELLHENDDAIMSDDELISFANTGEVLPNPVSSLSYDLIIKPLRRATSRQMRTLNDYDDGLVTTHNRITFNLYSSIYRRFPKEIDIGIRMVEMAIHGHIVADSNIADIARHRHRTGIITKLEVFVILLESLLKSWYRMKKTVKEAKKMSIDKLMSDNPNDFLREMIDSYDSIYDFSYYHATTSTASTATQFIAMSVLMEGEKDFTTEVCNEISVLLSSGGVLSAEVPVVLAKICQDIETSGKTVEFRSQPPKEAMRWLETNLPHVYDTVNKFLGEHGHRAVMEFDLITKPWILVPEELMAVLQNINSKQEKQVTKTSHDIVKSLKTPKKSGTRTVLRWLIPLLRTTIRQRECTKAYLILSVHKIRIAAIQLGKLLVKQWYLPHEDLIFHFRIHELKRFVQTRDPALLRKAMQRRQHYSAWCKLRFNELSTGWVDAVQPQLARLTAGDVRIDAASVCSGEVVARACVIKDFSEIKQLKEGDVLITHSTDIGWSPYFPLLTGIVTELGGIVSHGAVIAREYGLPCIVGAGFATDVFKTGDMVRLSGTEGFIERIKDATVAENEENKTN